MKGTIKNNKGFYGDEWDLVFLGLLRDMPVFLQSHIWVVSSDSGFIVLDPIAIVM